MNILNQPPGNNTSSINGKLTVKKNEGIVRIAYEQYCKDIWKAGAEQGIEVSEYDYESFKEAIRNDEDWAKKFLY